MKKYKYVGYDRYGNIKYGTCSASDEIKLKEILKKERIRIKKFSEITTKIKISKEEILNFTKEILIMLDSGISVIKILEIQEQQYKAPLKDILGELKRDILNGDTLGEAFKKYEEIFGSFYIGMIFLGESSGNLDKNLRKICEYLELEIKIIKKIKEVIFYPCILLTFSILILTFLMIYIFPNFIKLFEESKRELPLLTRILIGVSNNFHMIILFFICILIIIIFFIRYIKKDRVLKEKYDGILLKVPIIKSFIIGNFIIRFSKNISIMLSSGIVIMDILKLLKNFFENIVIKRELEIIEELLFEGKQLSEGLKKNNLFPQKYIKLVIVGEKSGELSKVFEQIAKLEEERIERDIKKLLTLVEPILIIILGLILSIIIIAIYLPIFNMSNLID
ncbi:type II secretion system F family protein [uncultured Fusobacterium sp.]|uniref:type II secretion system F family protein n=1 Tax=uncultured Fusobacterium sp. TaxID=159267 RepID=UPI0025EC4454|nr:type II secretion system F family protein [uncultured Fusobacterium sp.]